jgi:hypothetical protein
MQLLLHVRKDLFMLSSTLQGKKNPSTDQEAVKSFLGLVKHAKEIKIDRYCPRKRARC